MIIFPEPPSLSYSLSLPIGEKGRGLIEICRLGISTPPGFIIPYDTIPTREAILGEVERLKIRTNGEKLSFSIRSSPEVSMPGMLNTVLNVDTDEDVLAAVIQVKESWNNPKAIYYREQKGIEPVSKLAVIVQKMVYGSLEKDSGTGVALTRNSFTNAPELQGEYKLNSQGDVVVGGSTSPLPLEKLRASLPNVYSQLEEVARRIDSFYKDAREIEFTFENSKLYVLQCRRFHSITRNTLFTVIAEGSIPLVRGLGASPGVVTGVIATTLEEVVELRSTSQKVILLRPETSVEDIRAIDLADGVITLIGGALSHAAVITRSMNKPCITNCIALSLKKGDLVTIDGLTGNVFRGKLKVKRVV